MAVVVNTVAPVVTGYARVGRTLHVNTGTWTGVPVSYTYQWLNYDGSDHNLFGFNGTTYVVRESDIGFALWVSVCAINVDSPSPGVEAITAHTANVPTPPTALPVYVLAAHSRD